MAMNIDEVMKILRVSRSFPDFKNKILRTVEFDQREARPTVAPLAAKPLYYVKGDAIFQRPVRNHKTGSVRMGFRVCTVADGVDPVEVCTILNRGEAPPADEPGGNWHGC